MPPVPNSAGELGRLVATGTVRPEENRLTLLASGLPPASFGLALASRSAAPPSPVTGSQGEICLGAPIGRFLGPGQVQPSSPDGRIELPLDLTALPTSTTFVAALPGTTWHFQLWYRDANPQTTSNFTSALAVTFQ